AGAGGGHRRTARRRPRPLHLAPAVAAGDPRRRTRAAVARRVAAPPRRPSGAHPRLLPRPGRRRRPLLAVPRGAVRAGVFRRGRITRAVVVDALGAAVTGWDGQYAELGAMTNFSFLEGASHPGQLIIQARAVGLAAVGVA